jgi:hypothetical protein
MRYIPLGTGSFLTTITTRIASTRIDSPVPFPHLEPGPLDNSPHKHPFASRRPSRPGVRHLDPVGASLWVPWMGPGDKTDIHHIHHTN